MNFIPKTAPAAFLAVVVLGLLLLLSLQAPTADAQQPDYTAQCSNGIAVPEPHNNQGLVQDCAALLAMGGAFTANPPLNWATDTSIRSWEGVVVGPGLDGAQSSDSVISLRLNGRLTGGSVSPALGNLASLIWLNLSNNQLTGSIPSKIGGLINLRELNLSDNQLTGSIPPEMGNQANLRFLLLDDNQLTGSIPPVLGNLAELQGLRLGGNQFTGCVPASLIDVSDNDLGSLGLPSCGASATPPPPPPPPDNGDGTDYTAQCSNGVAVPDAQNNPGLVQDCAALLATKDAFTGGGTPNWSADTLIQNWEGIRLESIQDGAYFRSRVIRMILNRDRLTGSISPELGNLTNLRELNLAINQLSGGIPPELGSLTNLRLLILSNNQLTGNIPPELGSLTNLGHLGLSNNQLTGNIPPELGNLINLRNLDLNDNQLTGNIPPKLGNLVSLGYLYLHNNQLTGSIPPELGDLPLSDLYLSGNQLTGCIPAALSDVSDNDFGSLGLPLCSASVTPPPDDDDDTDYTAKCSNGVAVPDPHNNPGLVQDCAALLAVQDAFTNGSRLD